MSRFKVSLASVEQVKQFVDAASRCPCDIDICSGRYVVNAKSIMGLFSLDLSEPVTVDVRGTEEQAEALKKDIAGLMC